jgi:hypothetical protein
VVGSDGGCGGAADHLNMVMVVFDFVACFRILAVVNIKILKVTLQ